MKIAGLLITTIIAFLVSWLLVGFIDWQLNPIEMGIASRMVIVIFGSIGAAMLDGCYVGYFF